MTQRSLYYSLFILAISFISTVRGDPCFLCATADKVVVDGRWSYKFSDGTSCKDAYLAAFKFTRYTSKCKSHKSKYQRKCCNKSVSIGNPSNGGTTTPKLPPYEGPVGNAPDCPICRTKEYPGKPNQFIIARYVGEFSCAQLFMRGYHGLISKTMCGPLQDYAYSVCGCGIYNPACSSDSEKCWGGSKYKAPYIIDYSALTTSSSTARNAGKRHLRGVDAGPQVISTTPMNPEDLHFEAMEQGEEDEDMEMIEEEEDEMIESPEDEEDR